MKKYIKLEDQIGELLFVDGVYCIKEKSSDNKISIYLDIENPDDYKQADTIEELCDELVFKDLDTNLCFDMNANHIKDIKDNWQTLMNNNYLKDHITKENK